MDALAHLNASLAGRYILEREIGRGGMATVYLARDARHDRPVAVKVLNPELGAVLGVERFLAEIRVTANLQHPNLLALFDSGDMRGADGTFLFYVMPYVEGESLRARLEREKQLPIDEAVRIATSAASALDYAHRHGVIHRDLKPENILLHEGQPLVADFGIALAVSNAGGGRITQTGLSLGTPQYMSPEQATGDRVIDGRTDVYSLGAVLYEMLTGEPPHTGATAQAIIARVITDKPRDVRATRDTVPPHVAEAIEQALAKLPADRWPTAQAFAEALGSRGMSLPRGVVTPGSVLVRETRRSRASVMIPAFAATALAFGAGGYCAARRAAAPPSVVRYALALPDSQMPVRRASVLASPDGARLAFVAPGRSTGEATSQIWIKRRDRHDAVPVAGTSNVRGFTFSPDGKWIAFVQSTATGPQKLIKVPAAGGVPVVLSDSVSQSFEGAAWLGDGTIVYTHATTRELRRISESGGASQVIWRSDTTRAFYPAPVSGDRGVLFIHCTRGICGGPELVVLDLATGTTRTLAPGVVYAQYVATGHVLFVQSDGRAYALPFDSKRLVAVGSPVPVMDSVFLSGGAAQPAFALSASGTLTMWRGAPYVDRVEHQMYWIDRAGRSSPLDSSWQFQLGAAGLDQAGWSLSPDGRRLAISLAADGTADLWVKRLPNGPASRITFHAGGSTLRPRFTPDGRFVSYLLTGLDKWDLYRTSADGTGNPVALLAPPNGIQEATWSRDGRWLLTRARSPSVAQGDISVMQVGVDSTPRPLVAGLSNEWGAALSPDGRWLAYVSDETGRDEVYVRPFPDVDRGKWQVSRGTGRSPVWSADGRELFYQQSDGQLMAMPIASAPTFVAGEARALFRLPHDAYAGPGSFVVAPDGRFLVARRVAGTAPPNPPLIVAENWIEELRRILP